MWYRAVACLSANSVDEMITSLGFWQTQYLHLSGICQIPHFAKCEHLKRMKSTGWESGLSLPACGTVQRCFLVTVHDPGRWIGKGHIYERCPVLEWQFSCTWLLLPRVPLPCTPDSIVLSSVQHMSVVNVGAVQGGGKRFLKKCPYNRDAT